MRRFSFDFLAAWLGRSRRRAIQLGIIVLTVGVAAVLGYSYVWQPLRQEFSLPPGVTAQNPAVNIDLLQQINRQRAERIQSTEPAFIGSAAQFWLSP